MVLFTQFIKYIYIYREKYDKKFILSLFIIVKLYLFDANSAFQKSSEYFKLNKLLCHYIYYIFCDIIKF